MILTILLIAMIVTGTISSFFSYHAGYSDGTKAMIKVYRDNAVYFGYGYWKLNKKTGETCFSWTEHDKITEKINESESYKLINNLKEGCST